VMDPSSRSLFPATAQIRTRTVEAGFSFYAVENVVYSNATYAMVLGNMWFFFSIALSFAWVCYLMFSDKRANRTAWLTEKSKLSDKQKAEVARWKLEADAKAEADDKRRRLRREVLEEQEQAQERREMEASQASKVELRDTLKFGLEVEDVVGWNLRGGQSRVGVSDDADQYVDVEYSYQPRERNDFAGRVADAAADAVSVLATLSAKLPHAIANVLGTDDDDAIATIQNLENIPVDDESAEDRRAKDQLNQVEVSREIGAEMEARYATGAEGGFANISGVATSAASGILRL